MSNLVGEDGLFTHSRQPGDIHDYRCFDDQSKNRWITGDELKDNPDWGAREKEKWYFFYRPYNYANNIGSYQKEKIRERLPVINGLREELSSFNALRYFSIFLLFVILGLCIYVQSWGAILIPLLALIFFHLKVQDCSEKLRDVEYECNIFKSEIDHLLTQQQMILTNRVSSDDIIDMFWYDIRGLENEILREHFNDEPERVISEVEEFYPQVDLKLSPNKRVSDPPFFPVIPSWGLLQSVSRSLRDGTQSTGLKAAGREIGDNIATFRKLSDGTPLYRLWYIQNLFFREKNINVISYCFDFITGKSYNTSVETFQYNHISNSSYSDDDVSYMVDESLVSDFGLEDEFAKSVYGCEVKVISFSSTSGRFFRCVLPNNNVVDGLERWSLHKNTTLYTEHDDSDEEVSIELSDMINAKYSYNDVINTLADQSVKVLRKKCNGSTPLTDASLYREPVDV